MSGQNVIEILFSINAVNGETGKATGCDISFGASSGIKLAHNQSIYNKKAKLKSKIMETFSKHLGVKCVELFKFIFLIKINLLFFCDAS